MKRKPQQSLRDFSQEIKKLVKIAYGDQDETFRTELSLEKFKKGLSTRLRQHMLHVPHRTLPEAVRIASDYLQLEEKEETSVRAVTMEDKLDSILRILETLLKSKVTRRTVPPYQEHQHAATPTPAPQDPGPQEAQYTGHPEPQTRRYQTPYYTAPPEMQYTAPPAPYTGDVYRQQTPYRTSRRAYRPQRTRTTSFSGPLTPAPRRQLGPCYYCQGPHLRRDCQRWHEDNQQTPSPQPQPATNQDHQQGNDNRPTQ